MPIEIVTYLKFTLSILTLKVFFLDILEITALLAAPNMITIIMLLHNNKCTRLNNSHA